MNLWCERKVSGVPEHSDVENGPPLPKKKKREQTEADTDEAFQQLREKHPKMEAPKLRLWAKLIQSGRHGSYDTPPQILLITGAPAPVKPKRIALLKLSLGQLPLLHRPFTPIERLAHLHRRAMENTSTRCPH